MNERNKKLAYGADLSKKMDFTKDYVVLSRLGQTLFKRALAEEVEGSETQRHLLARSVEAYERALAVDPEDVLSHYGLSQCFARLGAEAPTGQSHSLGTVEILDSLTHQLKNVFGQVRTDKAVELADTD